MSPLTQLTSFAQSLYLFLRHHKTILSSIDALRTRSENAFHPEELANAIHRIHVRQQELANLEQLPAIVDQLQREVFRQHLNTLNQFAINQVEHSLRPPCPQVRRGLAGIQSIVELFPSHQQLFRSLPQSVDRYLGLERHAPCAAALRQLLPHKHLLFSTFEEPSSALPPYELVWASFPRRYWSLSELPHYLSIAHEYRSQGGVIILEIPIEKEDLEEIGDDASTLLDTYGYSSQYFPVTLPNSGSRFLVWKEGEACQTKDQMLKYITEIDTGTTLQKESDILIAL